MPIDAAAKLCPAEDKPLDPNCFIKGNLHSKGGCIFHMPGDASYFKLSMKKPGIDGFAQPKKPPPPDAGALGVDPGPFREGPLCDASSRLVAGYLSD